MGIMETRMGKPHSSHIIGRAISEAAAARAVDDVIIAMSKAGFSDELAKGIGYAAQEFLVGEQGYEARARVALEEAGFKNGQVDMLIKVLSQALSGQSEAA